jgi:Cu+-exporting ATPase
MTAVATGDLNSTAPGAIAASAPSRPLVTAGLALTGMRCASCVALIEASLEAHPGVAHVRVDLETARATVAFDAGVTGPDELCGVVAAAGYGASVGDISVGAESAGAGSADSTTGAGSAGEPGH